MISNRKRAVVSQSGGRRLLSQLRKVLVGNRKHGPSADIPLEVRRFANVLKNRGAVEELSEQELFMLNDLLNCIAPAKTVSEYKRVWKPLLKNARSVLYERLMEKKVGFVKEKAQLFIRPLVPGLLAGIAYDPSLIRALTKREWTFEKNEYLPETRAQLVDELKASVIRVISSRLIREVEKKYRMNLKFFDAMAKEAISRAPKKKRWKIRSSYDDSKPFVRKKVLQFILSSPRLRKALDDAALKRMKGPFGSYAMDLIKKKANAGKR